MSKKTFFSLLDRVQKDFSTIRGYWDIGQKWQKWAGQLGWLGLKLRFSKISWICLIRFRWNFEEMFLVWKKWRLMSLVTCSPILAWACPSISPKLGHIWSQNIPCSIYLEFGSSDFEEILRKCSWYKENEDWWVWSHVRLFLPGHAHHLDQIRPFLVPNYTFFNISWIWFIRFRWNFEEMFLV